MQQHPRLPVEAPNADLDLVPQLRVVDDPDHLQA